MMFKYLISKPTHLVSVLISDAEPDEGFPFVTLAFFFLTLLLFVLKVTCNLTIPDSLLPSSIVCGVEISKVKPDTI